MDACLKGFCLQKITVPIKIFLERVTSAVKTDTSSSRSVRQSVGRSRNDKVTTYPTLEYGFLGLGCLEACFVYGRIVVKWIQSADPSRVSSF
ncbi:hypothetical protein TNCT_338191 [Trichonephila clavata]|uniref:Uncharacterized protein n=1 Tax=Trichonephila clavata TaxID=2740835 RepID=A0A8X6KX83_TRICU|nr:hypothetical protein TNCT_338191 [Trichonephila clavata]